MIFQCNPNRVRDLLVLAFLVILSVNTYGQVTEFGAHIGYNFSRFKLDNNKLNDQVFVKAGKPFSGFTFGTQVMISPPKAQSTSKFRIVPSVLFEASLCRCGGNIELSLTSPTGIRTFNELSYLLYRGDYSVKFVGKIKGFQFLIGPTLTNRFYSAVRIGATEGYRYAGDHFKPVAVGYEIGIGSRLNTVQLSARYYGIIGAYGRKTDLIPTAYKNYQLRFMIHYFFLRKEKGQNWGSIYWY